MRITFDPTKRDRTLRERGLDFADAAKLFSGRHATIRDERRFYGETRFITAGFGMPGLSCWIGPRAAQAAGSSR